MDNTNNDGSKQILIAVTTLQADVKNLSQKMDDISNISTLAHETNQSVKSAHNRIDDMKEDYQEKLDAHKVDFDKLSDNIQWLWRSVVLGLIGMLFQFFTR